MNVCVDAMGFDGQGFIQWGIYLRHEFDMGGYPPSTWSFLEKNFLLLKI
jgi:hypothetical protein